MAGQSDRERAEKLAQDKEKARTQAKTEELQQQTARAQQQADLPAQDQQKTEEIFHYCQQQFTGFKLVPTGHEISVSKAGSSKIHDIQSDGLEYVYFHISHWGEETGNFQGQIPVLLTRYCNGEYQLIDADGKRAALTTLAQVKDKVVAALSDMDRDCVKRLFAKVRSRLGK